MLHDIQNRGSGVNMIENVHIPHLGPPGQTENDFLIRGVVMFGFKMLGLVNFDKRGCYVLFIKQEKICLFHPWARQGPQKMTFLYVE